MELLAPAGSMEALRAAVCNGADAVYLGADTFNARINARNFSAADLQEAVVYCHVRGVKVHLTLNTLVLDREMPRAAELIRLALLNGAAGVVAAAAASTAGYETAFALLEKEENICVMRRAEDLESAERWLQAIENT